MLDLAMQITVDAAKAKAELRDIEQGYQKIDAAAAKSGQTQTTWWQKEEQSIEKVTGTIASHRAELSKVEQAYAKAEAATSAAEQTAAKLGSTSVATTAALSGVSAESTTLTGGLEGLAAAGGLSAGALSLVAGGAVVAASAIGSLIGIVVKATAYYYQHSEATRDSREEQENLTKAWNEFQMGVGRAVLGEDFSAVKVFRLMEAAIYAAEVRLSSYIEMYKSLLGLNTTQEVLGLNNPIGAIPDPSKILGGKNPMGSLFGWVDHGAGAMDVPTGAQAWQLFQEDEAKRQRQLAAARRAAAERERHYQEGQRAFEHGAGTLNLGLSGRMGELVPVQIPGSVPSMYLQPFMSLPGARLEKPDAKDFILPPSFGSRLTNALGHDLGRTLDRLLIERTQGGSALGGAIGGDIFGSLMSKGSGSEKTISGALSGLFGGKLGGAIGSFLPFGGQLLGSLVGKLFGGLFGETQGHKDLMAGNRSIDEMKAALAAQYGSAAGAQNASNIFGGDLTAAWGSQNLAGAEHFKTLLGELAQKQAAFNSDLGGTLGKIKDLGGGIPEALRPYLQQLQDAKVLTQDNISLIAQMSGDTTVDFDKMQEAANRYGIAQDKLGQPFKDHVIHQGWQQIIDDLDLFGRGNADVNALLGDMGDEISALVNQSVAFGTSIPENMKPWIQKLIDTGKLLGANGEAITDINSLTFGDSMQTSLEKLNATLKELIDALSVKLPAAARSGAAGVTGAFDGMQFPDPVTRRERDEGYSSPGATAVRVATARAAATSTIIIEASGDRIARLVVPHLPGEVKRYGRWAS